MLNLRKNLYLVSIALLTTFVLTDFAIGASKPITVKFHSLRACDAWGRVGLPNPERGFRYEARIGEDEHSTNRLFAPSKSVSPYVPPPAVFSDDQWVLGMQRWQPFGVTVMQAYCYLTEYNNRLISQHKLSLIKRSLQRVRQRGYKVILRFAYEKDMSCHSGANPELMLRHIEQLKPILEEYSDVIFAMYAGFFGAWGEWHSDRYTDNRDFVTRGEIVRALCDALADDDCPVLMRTPSALLGILDSPYFNKERKKYVRRFGLNNDAFLAEDACNGEYSPNATGENRRLYNFVLKSAAYMLIDGELFWSNLVQLPRRQIVSDFPNDGLRAAKRLRNQHYTCLSLAHCYSDYEGKPYAIDYWMKNKLTAADLREYNLPFADDYFKDQFGNDVTRTQFEYIRDHLGYNLQLISATFPRVVRKGDKITIAAKLKNYGFSAPIRKRNVYFCLIDIAGNVHAFKVSNTDVRNWQPYAPNYKKFKVLTHIIKATVNLSNNFKSGWYQLGIWLPDIHRKIHLDSRYAIRFANRDTNWWTNDDGKYGINLIGIIHITR